MVCSAVSVRLGIRKNPCQFVCKSRVMCPGAGQARIQDSEGGGGSYIQKGGGVRTGISGADPNCCRALGKSTSKTKIADSRRGGGSDHSPRKTCIRACWVLYCSHRHHHGHGLDMVLDVAEALSSDTKVK